MKSNGLKILIIAYVVALTAWTCPSSNAQDIIKVGAGYRVALDSAVVMPLTSYRLIKRAVTQLEDHIDSLYVTIEQVKALDSLNSIRVITMQSALTITSRYNAELNDQVDELNYQFNQYVQATKPPKGFFKRSVWVIRKNWPYMLGGVVVGLAIK
jgi:hypothetical protein